MEKENEQISEAKTAVRKHRTFGETVSHNFWLKVLALLFSILLWSYVINETNPVRSKIFSDLPITVNGLSELQGQRLVPLEDLSVKLPRMSVTLNIPHKELGNVNASSIQIYIDLSRVTATGRQTVPVNVVCNNADVRLAPYSPQNVEIVIDELASAIIPVRRTPAALCRRIFTRMKRRCSRKRSASAARRSMFRGLRRRRSMWILRE